jgi:hypothetical protein
VSFWDEALPYAQQAHSQTGVLTSVILAQWANETGYGGVDWSVYHNPGNVGDPAAGGQTTYPTLQAGVDAYISTMLLPYYAAVRSASTWQTQCAALGASPWAASHYGNPPGEDLVQIINANDLTQYDGSPAPTPVPTPPQPTLGGSIIMGITELSNGNIAVDAVGTGSVANHQLVFIIDPGVKPITTSVIDATDGVGAQAPGGTLYTVSS